MLLCILLGGAAGLVRAQSYPDKRITLYIGFSAGGPTDLAFRALADAASRTLNQRVVIENRPGASGTLGSAAVVRAKPNGYALCHLASNLLRLPHVSKLDYDPLNDLTWIVAIADYLGGVVVKADAPWKTWQDFIAYGKANPRKLSYATTGVGGGNHLAMAEVGRLLGVDWVMVPYKSSPDAINAVLGGEIQASSGSGGWMQFVRDGRLRLLVATGDRLPSFPDTPTFSDLGYGVTVRAPFGIGGPRAMDPKVVTIIQDAFRQAMKDPEVVKVMERYELSPSTLAGADYLKWARERFAYERTMVEKLGLKR